MISVRDDGVKAIDFSCAFSIGSFSLWQIYGEIVWKWNPIRGRTSAHFSFLSQAAEHQILEAGLFFFVACMVGCVKPFFFFFCEFVVPFSFSTWPAAKKQTKILKNRKRKKLSALRLSFVPSIYAQAHFSSFSETWHKSK